MARRSCSRYVGRESARTSKPIFACSDIWRASWIRKCPKRRATSRWKSPPSSRDRSSTSSISRSRRNTRNGSRRISRTIRSSSFRRSRQWTSETLLVQEHIVGIPGVDRAGVDAAGFVGRVLAARGAEALLRMILIDGFFHADPHPGNVFYLPGNRIVIIDFGMVGRLSPRRRREVIDLLAGLAQMEEEPMLDVLLDWAEDAYVDEARLSADINDLAFEYEGAALADIRI